jgi:tRNA uridine 5-carboxymethylaminomethyl modification enzyme
MNNYDVIVIGAGHAGIEAALACARLGCKTLMVTLRADTVGHMSCNPAIGGVGKGQLVKEIDALGGEMGLAADACAMQLRILNASKGPAVQSSRAQIDRKLYKEYMTRVVSSQDGLSIKETEVSGLIIEAGRVKGVITDKDERIPSECVVIASGTFLDGLIHIGLNHHPGGRINEPASVKLAGDLKAGGLRLLRFKTGTCPRLDKNSIDFSRLIIQEGDTRPKPFSFSTVCIKQKQVPCHITYTNPATHQIIRDNLDKSPLYAGIIKSTGVRYCPSIEDKIVKFSDKQRHQVFLEPEGYDTDQVYPNGLSTSLPEEVQIKMVHSIAGLEAARILQFGYGIEHTVVEPTQLYPTLETKVIANLYLAGQINGTTGYEEAAAQGLVAGINAALRCQKREPFILDRACGYIGVLIDDLTTKGTNEPYRMFTSRVEYRLILREDNADLRLTPLGYDIGLVKQDKFAQVQKKRELIAEGSAYLKGTFLKPSAKLDLQLIQLHTPGLKKKTTLEDILKRPQIDFAKLLAFDGVNIKLPELVSQQLEIEVKYRGFIQRQCNEVERFRNLEKIKIPAGMDFTQVKSLSREIREKLAEFRPLNLGQAARISGVTPAAISILMVFLRKNNAERSRDKLSQA